MDSYSMNEVQNCLNGKLFDNCLGKWFYYPEDLPLVVQIETLLSDEILIYASFDKSGGAYLSSFLNLLMIEEINAISAPYNGRFDNKLATISGKKGLLPLHQVDGSVSLTFFSILSCTAQQDADLALIIYEFTDAIPSYLPKHIALNDQKCWEARISSLAETKLSQMIADTSD